MPDENGIATQIAVPAITNVGQDGAAVFTVADIELAEKKQYIRMMAHTYDNWGGDGRRTTLINPSPNFLMNYAYDMLTNTTGRYGNYVTNWMSQTAVTTTTNVEYNVIGDWIYSGHGLIVRNYVDVSAVKEDGDVWENHNEAVYVTKVQGEDYQVEQAFFKAAEEDNTQWEHWVAQDEDKREQREIARRQIENELQARRERESARRAEDERRKQNEAVAHKRSLAILSHHLTDDQRQEYITKRLFHFKAKSGRVYRLQEGTHGNVFAVEDGRDVERFCIQPSDACLPKPDVVLSQLLMLKTNEDEFRRIANISNLRDYRRPQDLRVA